MTSSSNRARGYSSGADFASPGAVDLSWCNWQSAIWNNNGDTALLLDSLGNIVRSLSY